MSLTATFRSNQGNKSNIQLPRNKIVFRKPQVQGELVISMQVPHKEGQRYALILYDETVNNPLWLHWLIVNIPGGMYKDGDEIAAYFPPSPPEGVHTYTLAIFEQKPGVTIQMPKITNMNKRPGFQLATLAPSLVSSQPVAQIVFKVQA